MMQSEAVRRVRFQVSDAENFLTVRTRLAEVVTNINPAGISANQKRFLWRISQSEANASTIVARS